MSAQQSLFSASNLANTVEIPLAPNLIPHTDWPFPGMTPENSARASMASSQEYTEMLAAVIKSKGGARMTEKEVLASIPKDWRDLCGCYVHGRISWSIGEQLGIKSTYVSHDGGGFHFEFSAEGSAA